MPELPEVETIRKGLEERLKGKIITKVDIRLPKLVQDSTPEDFKKDVESRRVEDIKRRAKILVINLSNRKSMLIHLKLSGQLICSRPSAPIDKFTHIIFHLSGDNELRFKDFRQFAYVKLVEGAKLSEISELQELGPEPLEDNFTLDQFRGMLNQRKRSRIKPLLMDQAFIAGIGNMYADEILWFAQVQPTRVISTLTEEEVSKIFAGMKKILSEAIAHRGASVDAYVDVEGKKGGHEPYLKVYRQDGKPCPRCGEIIERIKLGGRGTHFCPKCQKQDT